MNLTDSKYSNFALVQEMMQTSEVVRKFDPDQTGEVAGEIGSAGKLLLSSFLEDRTAFSSPAYWKRDFIHRLTA
jgi:hypothetical protein